jgi:hypothetical protein
MNANETELQRIRRLALPLCQVAYFVTWLALEAISFWLRPDWWSSWPALVVSVGAALVARLVVLAVNKLVFDAWWNRALDRAYGPVTLASGGKE